MNRFQPPSRRPNLAHPLCRGLRLFSVLNGVTPHNRLGGQIGTPTSAPVAISGPAGPCLKFLRASNQRVTFGPPNPATGSVTCIVCAKPSLPTGSVAHQLAGDWDDTGALKKGFLLYATDYAPELGISFICGDGAGAFSLISTLDQTCFNGDFHIFAGRYHAGDGISRVYQDGYQKGGDSAASTGKNTGSALGLQVGGNSADAALASTSAIAWVALFDVALTEGEILKWSNGTWPMFDYDRTAMFVTPPAAANSSPRVLTTGRHRR